MHLPSLGLARGLLFEEWLAVRAQLEEDVRAARERVVVAEQIHARTGSRRSSGELARSVRSLWVAERLRLALRTYYMLGPRAQEHASITFDRCELMLDGSLHVVLRGKPKPRTPEGIEQGVASHVDWRPAVILTELAGEILAWVRSSRPDGKIPSSGLLWGAGLPGQGFSVSALERGLHGVAVRAGVQRFQGMPRSRSRVAKAGVDRRTHRYLVTLKSLRELSERRAIPHIGRETAARVHGHSDRVQLENYFEVTWDEARTAAMAREV